MSLALFESGFLQEFRDSVHLDQMLDVLLFVQPLFRYLQFRVTLEAASTPAPTTTKALFKATAQFFEASDKRVHAEACIEVQPALHFSTEESL